MVSTSVTGRRPETHRSIGSLKSEAESQFEGLNEEAIPSSLVGQARADAHDAGRIPTLGRRDRAPPRRAVLEPAMDNWTGKDLLAHMAWWHNHSVLVIDGLRAGRQPYEASDPSNTTDAINERIRHDHLDDPPELTRRAFNESFTRLLAALEPVADEELFAVDRWQWLSGEALVETILWDSLRHYDAHREHLERLSR